MYLISTMSRPDVWPIGDYGVRVGWTLLHGLDETISEKIFSSRRTLRRCADVGRWYCWEAVHWAKAAK